MNSKTLSNVYSHISEMVFFHFLLPNSALTSAQQMELLGFLPTTLCRGMRDDMSLGVIRTHVSQ